MFSYCPTVLLSHLPYFYSAFELLERFAGFFAFTFRKSWDSKTPFWDTNGTLFGKKRPFWDIKRPVTVPSPLHSAKAIQTHFPHTYMPA